MEAQSQLRVGIVGCGYQGYLMAQAIAKTEMLRMTACADPNRHAAAKVAALAGNSNIFASAEEMLAKSEVDAVFVVTPHHLLQEIALLAIRAGKHVLAEKPIAINEQEAIRIEEAVAKTDICYMSGYSLRFFIAQKSVYDLLEAGAIGDIQVITAGMGTQPLSGWFARPETGGGALLYLGSHLVDQILWYLRDRPIEVYANVRDRSDTNTDETAVFQIRFERGAVAQCLVTQAADGWFDYIGIYGRDGHINLVSSYWLQYNISVSSKAQEAYAQPTMICPRLTDHPILMMLVPELEEFAAAIQEKRQPAITVGDGRWVLKVLDAVIESGQTGKPVRIG